MKATLARANISYQSFYKKPLLGAPAANPGLLEPVYDVLSENFAISISDIIGNRSVSPADNSIIFKLFGGVATIEIRADCWKAFFPGVVSEGDLALIQRCLFLVAPTIEASSTRTSPARASVGVAGWYKSDAELDATKMLRAYWAPDTLLEDGFLDSEKIEYTLNPKLINSAAGWDASYVIQPSALTDSHIFINYTANYICGGAYSSIEAQVKHSRFLVVGMLERLGFNTPVEERANA